MLKLHSNMEIFSRFFSLKKVASKFDGFYSTETWVCWNSLYLNIGGMFARRAPGALLLDYVPPEEPPSTPLGNALRIR